MTRRVTELAELVREEGSLSKTVDSDGPYVRLDFDSHDSANRAFELLFELLQGDSE